MGRCNRAIHSKPNVVAAAAIILLITVPAMAQTASSDPPRPSDSLRALLAARPAVPPKIAPGITILSDTQGVDFNPYLSRLHANIQGTWSSLTPRKAMAPEMKKGIVSIRFTIRSDGQIGSMSLEARSGDIGLDKAAWYAITSVGRFDPLPVGFHGPLLDLRAGFYYNIPPDPKPDPK